jgi:uncharacterized membrane protein YkoI
VNVQRRTRIVAVGITLAVGAALGSGVAAAANGGDDDERPIAGDALARASAAALEHTPGRVTDTEEGDEESLYEVEVTKADGSQVDVQLDQDFKVVGSDADDDTGEDGD